MLGLAIPEPSLLRNSHTVEVDETNVSGQDDEALGRNEWKKKLVVPGIEKKDAAFLECTEKSFKWLIIRTLNPL
jgi:hypothetical protein